MTEQVLPQIALAGAGVNLDPDRVLTSALNTYRAGVVVDLERRILSAPTVALTREILGGILLEVASGHLNVFRVTAGVAFRMHSKRALARQQLPINETYLAQRADDAAMNLGTYLAATSSNAVIDGFELGVNRALPPKEAARRAARGFGLTTPQMRTALNLKEQPVDSSRPGALRSFVENFIDRAFGRRAATVVENSLRQVLQDAIAAGWEDALEDGIIPAGTRKMWVTAADERTCPVCAPMDGVTVEIMDRFRLPDGNKVKMPGVHPNCRCQAELIYPDETDEEIAKADDAWRTQPRTRSGQFSFKTQAPQRREEARANVDRLFADIALRQGPQAGAARVSGPGLRDQPQVRQAPGVLRAERMQGPAILGSAQVAPAAGLRTHAVLGGAEINLARLNMTHQMQVADTMAQNEAQVVSRAPRIPEQDLDPIGKGFVAFASEDRMNALYFAADRAGNGDEGTAQIEIPLRFINRHSPGDVRDSLDEAMDDLDAHLREESVEYDLDEMGRSKDPGMAEAAADLRMAVLAGKRTAKGKVQVGYSVEDAQEAWRSILAPQGTGYSQSFEIDAYDETGTTVGRARVSAATLVAMTNVSPQNRFVPRVVVAPHGAWKTESGFGATDTPPDSVNHKMVTGAFKWRHERGIFLITPDDGVYRRANPEG